MVKYSKNDYRDIFNMNNNGIQIHKKDVCDTLPSLNILLRC